MPIAIGWGRWIPRPTQNASGDDAAVLVAGQLQEPFSLLESEERDSGRGSDDLRPGEPYDQSLDKDQGSYWLRQKAGGVIERRRGARTREFAVVEGARDPK